MKKIVSIALVLLLIVAMVPMAVFADESKATDIVDVTGKTEVTLGGVTYKVVKTVAEITDPAGNYYLANDLTLEAPLLEGQDFTGKFNGGKHTITLNGAKSVFKGIIGGEGCLIANLTVKGPEAGVEFPGYAGILNEGYTNGGEFYNITNKVDIKSTDFYIGGLIGPYSNGASAPVKFVNCTNEGNITSTKSVVGGIFSGFPRQNQGQNINAYFENCKNTGNIDTLGYTGGMMGTMWDGTLGTGEIVIKDCENTGNIGNIDSTDNGGILGGLRQGTIAKVLLENCKNSGTVMGINRNGGIVGGANTLAVADWKIVNCHNTGDVTSSTNGAAGIMGGFGSVNSAFKIDIQKCTNTGKISNTTDKGTFGTAGIVGYFNAPKAAFTLNVSDCVNFGDIYSKQAFVGGIVGGNYNSTTNVVGITIENCVNFGNVSSDSAAYGTGGIFGGTSSATAVTFNLKSNVNFGKVTAGGTFASGVLGYNNANDNVINLDGCYNAGVVATTSDENATASEIININGTVTADVKNCKTTGTNKLANVELADTNGTGTLANAVDAANKTGALEETLYVKDGAVASCTSHTFANGSCSVCGAADPNYVAPNPPAGGNDPVTPPAGGNDPVTPPETSDITVFVLAIAVVALAGVCVATKKIRE